MLSSVPRMLRPLFAAVSLLAAGAASAADPAQIDEGLRLFRGVGQCDTCHVWTGTGGLITDLPPHYNVPSLVTSKLTRQELIDLLACGTPGGVMPQFLARAWTEPRRCYGKVLADLPPEERAPKPFSAMTQPQIEAVVAFIQEVYQGKGMSFAYCQKYHGEKSPACDFLR